MAQMYCISKRKKTYPEEYKNKQHREANKPRESLARENRKDTFFNSLSVTAEVLRVLREMQCQLQGNTKQTH